MLLKWLVSFKCFTSQGECLHHTFMIYHYRLWNHEYECASLKGPSLLFQQKSRTLGLLKQRCMEDTQPHLTLNKDLSLHLQSTGRRSSLRVSFLFPTSLFADFIWVLLFRRATYWLPSSVSRYARKYSALRDSRWRNLGFFTPHLWFNCRSADWLLFQKENRWLCHSVCINCSACLLYAVNGKW